MEQNPGKPEPPRASQYFQYGVQEMEYLIGKDKKLGAAIERIGIISRPIIPDPFTALISSIVSQQISKKAAETVWARLANLLDGITPETIQGTELAAIQACGMSTRKATYIKGIAQAALTGQIDFASLHTMEDQEIISQLSALQGVGVWTAEMLLIFSLNRPNVLSYNDLAIRRGMMNLYRHKDLPRERFDKYRTRYSPYCSVASLYLWKLSGQD